MSNPELGAIWKKAMLLTVVVRESQGHMTTTGMYLGQPGISRHREVTKAKISNPGR